MSRDHSRAVAEIGNTMEFRSLVEKVLGPDAEAPLDGIGRLFDQPHRTVLRWYSGLTPIPTGIMARMRAFAAMSTQLDMLRTDLDSVLADAKASGIPEILVGIRMASYAEAHSKEPVAAPDETAETETETYKGPK